MYKDHLRINTFTLWSLFISNNCVNFVSKITVISQNFQYQGSSKTVEDQHVHFEFTFYASSQSY